MTHTKSMTDVEYIRELEAENSKLKSQRNTLILALELTRSWAQVIGSDPKLNQSSKLMVVRIDEALNRTSWHEEIKDMEARG